MQCIELSFTELDLVVLGALNSFMNLSCGKKRHRMCYFFRSVQVCKETFLFVYGIGKYRLQNLKAHLKRHGIAPRTHGNTARLPKNALAHETLNRAVTFVKNFASEQAVALPGRVPNFKNLKVQLLPSCESKASVWRHYVTASEEKNLKAVSYTKFVALWNTLILRLCTTSSYPLQSSATWSYILQNTSKMWFVWDMLRRDYPTGELSY